MQSIVKGNVSKVSHTKPCFLFIVQTSVYFQVWEREILNACNGLLRFKWGIHREYFFLHLARGLNEKKPSQIPTSTQPTWMQGSPQLRYHILTAGALLPLSEYTGHSCSHWLHVQVKCWYTQSKIWSVCTSLYTVTLPY